MGYEIEDMREMRGRNIVGRKSKYPFDRLRVGDGFTVDPGPKIEAIRRACQRHGSRMNRDFRCEMLSDNSIKVWREE